MNKENIYVVIDSESKRVRAIQILNDAGENIDSELYYGNYLQSIRFYDNQWIWTSINNLTEITLDKLEEILVPKQEIKLDELKLIAESYGFELVEKKREIKVGDFGKFESSETIY